MSTLGYILIAPLLWSVTIPLIVFAAFTTSLAFTTLLLRALAVYLELAAALIQSRFAQDKAGSATNGFTLSSSSSSKLTLPYSGGARQQQHARRKSSRRGSAASGGSSGGTITPREQQQQQPSSGLGVYGGQSAARDFEGVGGWRIPGPSDDDQPWLNINSRLELPTLVDGAGGRRNHHRSRTSGSLASIPLPVKSPTPPGGGLYRPHPGSASPEEYFGHRVSSKSTTALDAANIGKALLRHQPSHSSASSGSSAHTSHLAISNT